MIVIKFGGTSLNTKDRIASICKIVKKRQTEEPIVVVSAIRPVTDLLLSCIEATKAERAKIFKQIEKMHQDLMPDIALYLTQCLRELENILSKKERNKEINDLVVSYGERLSSYIIASILNKSGVKARQVLATDLIVTNNHFGSAEFIPDLTEIKIKKVLTPLIKQGVVPVVTGFIAATKDNRVTTFGRGGSDYSASIIGYSLKAEEIQIWTDVDGVFTADPRIVPTAKHLQKVSFSEASELAAFGARVLHPRSMRPAIKAGIPVRILNTSDPENPGTLIDVNPQSVSKITAITSKKKTILINIYSNEMLLSKGFLARIFTVFSKHNISIDLVSVSEVSISVTLDNADNLTNALSELSKFTSVAKIQDFGIVSLVGERIVEVKNIMKNIFTILDKNMIVVKMISLGATDINISLVIKSDNIEKAVKSLHNGILLKS